MFKLPKISFSAIAGIISTVAAFLAGIFMMKSKTTKQEHKTDSADTKAQVKLDRLKEERDDEEVIDDFTDKFTRR